MTVYFIGDLLTGRRIQTLRALSPSNWSEVLNDAGDLSCTVSLRDPAMRRLGLREAATPGKSFLAAFDGDHGLQAGPIWLHDWDEDSGKLTLLAGGMWSYFDHRALLPVLAGRLPSDPTTDTRFWPVDADPTYPWVSDTRTSLQGIARALVAQAQTETNGDVPVILPDEIAGTAQRSYRGVDVARVGDRLRELTQVIDGPDIKFTPQWTTDRLGVEWTMQIGTPDQPLIFSPQEQVFNVGVARSSVSNFRSRVNGAKLGSRAFSSGGAAAEAALVSVSTDDTLLEAGFPVLDLVDSARSTVTTVGVLQEHSDELVLRGRQPTTTMSFSHRVAQRPYLGSFVAGDFVRVRLRNSLYHEDGTYRMRVTSRSGDVAGERIKLTLSAEVS